MTRGKRGFKTRSKYVLKPQSYVPPAPSGLAAELRGRRITIRAALAFEFQSPGRERGRQMILIKLKFKL